MTTQPVRIPADVDRPDRLVAGLTGRQLIILVGTAMLLYLGWSATRTVVPLPGFLLIAVPVGGGAALLALGQRDGMSLDRLALAAVRQHLQPRHRVAAPDGVRPAPSWLTPQTTRTSTGHPSKNPDSVALSALRLPAEAVTDTGVVDLGGDGVAVVAVASTVNFGLRTSAEQDSLVASFGRYLHSLTNPAQVLIRTHRLDLSGQITELREAAASLPHPALEAAAREHADYLTQLATNTDLLRRQVLLVLREPVSAHGTVQPAAGGSPLGMLWPRGRANHATAADRGYRQAAAAARLTRRLAEAADLLSPAGIVITPLDAGQATAVLAAACNPDNLVPPTAGLAGADEVITTVPDAPDVPYSTVDRTQFAGGATEPRWSSADDPAPAVPDIDSWEVQR
jgi:PrgI family protein